MLDSLEIIKIKNGCLRISVFDKFKEGELQGILGMVESGTINVSQKISN